MKQLKMFAMVDYIRGVTMMPCKCGEYEPFEPLLFLFTQSVCTEVLFEFIMISSVRFEEYHRKFVLTHSSISIHRYRCVP